MDENKFNEIINRINDIKSEKSSTLSSFSIGLDLPASTVHNYVLGRRTPDLKFLLALCENYQININWILTGEGSPYLDKQSHDDLTPLEIRLLALTKRYDEQGIDQIIELFEQLPLNIKDKNL